MAKVSFYLVSSLFILALVFAGCSANDPDDFSKAASLKDRSDKELSPSGSSDGDGITESVTAGSEIERRKVTEGDNADNTYPPDVEYEPLTCQLPNPEGLPEGVLFGGDSATSTVKVYVYDDRNCEPINLARVVEGYSTTGQYTNADGMVTIPVYTSPVQITAIKSGYSAWAYVADASVMYFRLKRNEPDWTTTDSLSGKFKLNGASLSLQNPPSLPKLLDSPFYGGLLQPGYSRSTYYSVHEEDLIPLADIDVGYLEGGYEGDYGYPASIFIPDVDIRFNVPGSGEFGFWAANDEMYVAIPPQTPIMPITGTIIQADAGQVFDMATIMEFLTEFLETSDIVDAVLLSTCKVLFNEGISFPYVGINPAWDTTTAPDIEMHEVGADGQTISLDVTNAKDGFGYFQSLNAEVPNRALVPLDLAFPEDGHSELAYARVPDADYYALTAKTDMFESNYQSSRFAVQVKYAEDISEWENGLTFDDDQFAPFFDAANTSVDMQTGYITWDFEQDASDIDLIWVILDRWYSWQDTPEVIMAVVPGDQRSFILPVDAIDMVGYGFNSMMILAVDLPFEYEDGFDPTRILGYDNATFSLWTEPALGEDLLSYLFSYINYLWG